MTQPLPEYAVLAFLVFCRVGTAAILLPGFSSQRFPTVVRLAFAIILSLAIAPMLGTQVLQEFRRERNDEVLLLIPQEIVVGLLIGATGSLLVHAARFAGDVISSSIGLGGIPGQPIDSNEPLGQIAALLAISVACLVFVTDLHILTVSALIDSYAAVTIGSGVSVDVMNGTLLTFMRDAFLLALQVASPFMAFGLLSNLTVGLVGRMAPKISLYFSITGAMAVAGIVLFSTSSGSALLVLIHRYELWLSSGFE